MTPFIDVHSHITPPTFPDAPNVSARSSWPCMQCGKAGNRTVMLGDKPFRKLDARSWDVERRLADMDRDRVAMQVLSPMPELLSYWLERDDAALICDAINHHIADMIALAPRRFRGLGAVPLQDPAAAATALRRVKAEFGLSGVEIGSNINGIMLGDPRFDPFWQAAEAEGMAVFIHALHPIAAKPLPENPLFTASALFPIDVAMAAASLITNGVLDRFPGMRVGFSHGGGALGSILGRLDIAWNRSDGYGGKAVRRPSEQAQSFFYDSNVYDPRYLRYLTMEVAPGRVFGGTDYPYDIMQTDPVGFVAGLGLDAICLDSLSIGAASQFLAEDFQAVIVS
jgi:aminocarboxymuconate-semialdehyde decarboxylase